MDIILRTLHFFLGLGLIGVVLLQRSEGGGLGIGSSGGMGSFMSVRGTANFLTRLTAILAGLFMLTSLVLALMANPKQAQRSIFDAAPPPGQTVPTQPIGQTPAPPAGPAGQAPAAPAQAPASEAPKPSNAPAPVGK